MNPRLPTIETCTSDGIVGRITSGPNAGEWVLAETYRDPSTGKVDFYSPYLPDEDLYDTHGSFVMSDGVVDVPRPPGVGGLIDELTNALDVEWHADPTCVEQERAAFAARYAQRGSLSPDAQPDRVMAMFREMSGLWLVGESNADELSRAAANVLAAGRDTPALRDVAGLYPTSTWWDVRPALERTWEQLGRPLPSNDDHLIVLALRAQCRRFITRQLTAGELTRWAHAVAGHDGPDLAQPLVDLDDDLDAALFGDSRMQVREFHAATRRAVDEFLADTARNTA
jgi:hypothetical protein